MMFFSNIRYTINESIQPLFLVFITKELGLLMDNNYRIQLIKLVLLICMFFGLNGCKKQLTWAESQSKFLNTNPQSKEFTVGLQGVANHLYAQRWPGKYRFTRPKIRHEKMLVEWEHKKKQKTIRKEANIRCTSNIERLGLSCLISALGPINLNKLLKTPEYSNYVEKLKIFLGEKEWKEELFKVTLDSKNKILIKFGISQAKAKENEESYKCGIIITTGFYLGFPFYKRITLDSEIENREEYLRVYLHECGHQLFDKDRKFFKTIKLGLSWIGWIKTTHSWWVVEEKSCNLISDEILETLKSDIKSDKRYKDSLATSNWEYLPLAPDYKEKYARLFFNPVSVLAQLKNTRVDSRYSTNDEIAKIFREKLKVEGVKNYIHLINKYSNLKDVLQALNASQLEDVSKQ